MECENMDSKTINFGHTAVATIYPLRLFQSCTVILRIYPWLFGRCTQILILGFMEKSYLILKEKRIWSAITLPEDNTANHNNSPFL
jgi:hypothetical protein